MTKKDNCKTSREADFMSGPAPEGEAGIWKVFGDKAGPFTFHGLYGQYRSQAGYCKLKPWQGDMLNPPGYRIGQVEKGVIHFTTGRTWPKLRLAELRERGWIRHNWSNEWEHARNTPARTRICEQALKTGGPILDIASGPGGGNLSPLLHMDPGVPLIINDIEPEILHM
ncbi:MAG: hypothetical protein ACOX4K_05730 [Bacillota bacterium]